MLFWGSRKPADTPVYAPLPVTTVSQVDTNETVAPEIEPKDERVTPNAVVAKKVVEPKNETIIEGNIIDAVTGEAVEDFEIFMRVGTIDRPDPFSYIINLIITKKY